MVNESNHVAGEKKKRTTYQCQVVLIALTNPSSVPNIESQNREVTPNLEIVSKVTEPCECGGFGDSNLPVFKVCEMMLQMIFLQLPPILW